MEYPPDFGRLTKQKLGIKKLKELEYNDVEHRKETLLLILAKLLTKICINNFTFISLPGLLCRKFAQTIEQKT